MFSKLIKIFYSQTDIGQNVCLVGKIIRKSAKLAMTTFNYRSLYNLFYAPVESSFRPRISGFFNSGLISGLCCTG